MAYRKITMGAMTFRAEMLTKSVYEADLEPP
jgi:hypothetical protein